MRLGTYYFDYRTAGLSSCAAETAKNPQVEPAACDRDVVDVDLVLLDCNLRVFRRLRGSG